MSQYEFIILAN